MERRDYYEVLGVSRDASDPCRIRYSETWTSGPPFRIHVRSEEFRPVLVALDMCSEEPVVTIGELAGRTGIEYLRELREGPTDRRPTKSREG